MVLHLRGRNVWVGTWDNRNLDQYSQSELLVRSIENHSQISNRRRGHPSCSRERSKYRLFMTDMFWLCSGMRNIPQTDAYVIQPGALWQCSSILPPSLPPSLVLPSSSPRTTTTTFLNVTTDHVTTPTCDNNNRPLSCGSCTPLKPCLLNLLCVLSYSRY